MQYDSEKIKEIYDIIDGKRQIELSDSLNTLIKEELIEILEKKGFEGIDNSLEESLFEYNTVYRRKDNLVIRYQNDIFDYASIDDNDILKIINEMRPGFFSYIGTKKEKYIQWFNTEDNKSMFIQDIMSYSGDLFEYFDLQDKENDIIRLIIMLNSEE